MPDAPNPNFTSPIHRMPQIHAAHLALTELHSNHPDRYSPNANKRNKFEFHATHAEDTEAMFEEVLQDPPPAEWDEEEFTQKKTSIIGRCLGIWILISDEKMGPQLRGPVGGDVVWSRKIKRAAERVKRAIYDREVVH